MQCHFEFLKVMERIKQITFGACTQWHEYMDISSLIIISGHFLNDKFVGSHVDTNYYRKFESLFYLVKQTNYFPTWNTDWVKWYQQLLQWHMLSQVLTLEDKKHSLGKSWHSSNCFRTLAFPRFLWILYSITWNLIIYIYISYIFIEDVKIPS